MNELLDDPIVQGLILAAVIFLSSLMWQKGKSFGKMISFRRLFGEWPQNLNFESASQIYIDKLTAPGFYAKEHIKMAYFLEYYWPREKR